MNAFSKNSMIEITRLTRAGRLAEAMALLRGCGTATGPIENQAASASATQGAAKNPAKTPIVGWITESIRAGRLGRMPHDRWKSFADFDGAQKNLDHGDRLHRAAPSIPEGARFEERIFEGHSGRGTYKVFVPSGYSGQALPVVIMLHGCTQDPDVFALGTRMNEVAEEQTFLVAYPRQSKAANMQQCWNWFRAVDQRRGHGEAALVAGIAMQVVSEFSADPTRVYVAGLSAGGAAAAILAEAYPDVFAAVGVHSGLACGAATDIPSAFAAMKGGASVHARSGASAAPTIVFHGDADATVHPVNGDQVIGQSTPKTPLKRIVTKGKTAKGIAYTRTVQTDASGRDLLEQWTLHEVGHAWSGGNSRGTYTEPRGPDASREMIRFFMQHRLMDIPPDQRP